MFRGIIDLSWSNSLLCLVALFLESDVTFTVTGNTAEHQLRGLKGSTVYMVMVSSKLGEQRSKAVSTRFTTAGQGACGAEGHHSRGRTLTLTYTHACHAHGGRAVLFAGAGGRGEGPRDLKASQVTPRSAVLSWKAPTTLVSSYKLTYQTAGQETKVRLTMLYTHN